MAIKFLNSVAVDTDVLFVDTANERVGIGTTNPKSLLEIGVSGTLGSVTNKVISTIIDGGYSTLNSLQYNVNAFIGTTYGTSDIFAQTSGEVLKNFYVGLVASNSYFNGSRYSITQGGAERLTVAQGGNVGIGTTSPGRPLSVQSSATSIIADFKYALAAYSSIDLSNTVGTARISSVNNDLVLSPGTNEKMRITSGGNVGIGTTSPAYKLDVDGNARVTGAYYDSGNTPGTVNQVLASTATGTAWIDPGTIVAEAATLVVIACKNTSGATIPKGTPVYQTGNVGATATIEIAPADALISANKLPAIGLLQTDLNNNGFGNVVITGELTNFTTSPIDGVVPTTGDKVFVKSGGGLTLTKPTGEGNGIQNMGLVGKVSGGNAGSITVSSIMRTNDVPNLPEGRIWVGDGNTIVSDTVYIDEPNNRVGIGTTSPQSKLHLATTGSSTLTIQNTTNSGNAALNFRDEGNNDQFQIYYALGANRSYNLVNGNGLTIYSSQSSSEIARFGNASSGYTDSYFTGNVGIGTTSPSAPLTFGKSVYGDFDSENFYRIKLQDQGGILNDVGIGQTATGNLGFNITAGKDFLFNGGTSGNALTLGSSGNATFAGTISVQGTGDSYFTGNVGIGTTNPNAKLEVRSDGANAAGAEIRLQHANNNTTDVVSTVNFANNIGSVGMIQAGTAGANNTGYIALFTDIAGTSSEKMRIHTNGNVGIGTTSPSTKLDVYGVTTSLGFRTDTTNTNWSLISRDSEGNAPLYVQSANSITGQWIARFNYGSATANGGDNVLTVAKDSSYFLNTNVGIGTTAPSTKLDVAGNANISDTLAIGSLSTVPTASLGRALNIQVLANSSGTTVAQWLDVDRTITTNSTSANTYGMLLRNASTTTSTANDGNIYGAQIIGRHQGTGGINSAMGVRGTADIDTTGTITATGSLWGAYNEGEVTNGSVTFSNSGIYGTASIAQVLGSGTVNITTRGIVGVGSVGRINNVNADVNRVVAGEFELDLQNGATEQAHVISLNTYNITSPTNLSIDEFAYIYLGEDVAIPTTVTDNAYFIKSLTSLPSELAGSIEATSFIKTGGTSSQFLKADGSVDSTSYAPATGGAYLPLSAGASYPLTDTLYLATASNLGKLQFGTANSDYYIRGGGNYGYININGPIVRFDTNASEKMRITSSGNVGIGTTSPGEKLVVNSGNIHVNTPSTNSSGNGLRLNRPGSYYAGIEIATNGTIDWSIGANLYGFGIYENGLAATTRIIIKDGGNVGIGTTNPSATLHVKNTTGNYPFIVETPYDRVGKFISTDSGADLIIQDSNSTDNGNSISVSGDTMSFRTAGSSRVRILANGNVGIGTTAPVTKLQVGTGSGATVDTAYQIVADGSAISGIQILSGTNHSGRLVFGDSDDNDIGIIKYDHSDNSLQTIVNASEKTRVTSAGILMVGGTTGGYAGTKIHVGNFTDTQNGINILSSTTGYGYVLFGDGTGADTYRGQITYYHGDDSMIFNTNGSERMRITSAGDTGIGVTTPRAKLDVAGGIKVADDTDTAGANKVGTLRYRTSGNNSYVDMCMQTGASTYAWINVVQNNW